MSNANSYNYENIDQPYNSMMERSSGETGVGIFGNTPIDYAKPIYNPVDKDLVLDGKNFDNVWINRSIRSKNYLPQKRGFKIDGIKGDIETAGIVATSMLRMKVYDYQGGTIGGPESSGGDYDQEGYMYVRINYDTGLNDNFRVFIGDAWRSVTTT